MGWESLESSAFGNVLGIPSLQTGVFGGIIVGALAAWCYNKWYRIELPPFLGFFAGKRFVPIATATLLTAARHPACFIWPPIGNGINAFADAIKDLGTDRRVHLRPDRALADPVRPAPHLVQPVLVPVRRVDQPRHRRHGFTGDQRMWFGQLAADEPFVDNAGDDDRSLHGWEVPLHDVRPAGRCLRDVRQAKDSQKQDRGRHPMPRRH